jgi:hypothetical protein
MNHLVRNGIAPACLAEAQKVRKKSVLGNAAEPLTIVKN